MSAASEAALRLFTCTPKQRIHTHETKQVERDTERRKRKRFVGWRNAPRRWNRQGRLE